MERYEEIVKNIKSKNIKIKNEVGYTPSVSKILKYIAKEFDAAAEAERQYKKCFDKEGTKYYQMSVADIMKQWDDKSKKSQVLGTMVDDYARVLLTMPDTKETWIQSACLDDNPALKDATMGLENALDVFKTAGYEYVGREIPLFVKADDVWINGRLDCLMYNPIHNKYLVIDWKSNEKIDKDGGYSKMFGPCYDKDDNKMNSYTLQIQFYKKALVEVYGLTDESNIDVLVCHLGNEGDAHYRFYKENFPYDSVLLGRTIKYCNERYLRFAPKTQR